jgi:hypothetical protein
MQRRRADFGPWQSLFFGPGARHHLANSHLLARAWTQKFANDRKDQYYWYKAAETYPHSQRAQINHMGKENWLITLEDF